MVFAIDFGEVSIDVPAELIKFRKYVVSGVIWMTLPSSAVML